VLLAQIGAGSAKRAYRQRKVWSDISLVGKCNLNNPTFAKHAHCVVGLAADDLQLGDFGLETAR
jgi:hypothetical protein